MKKIKKFRINIRHREVLRLLKASAQVSPVTPEIEETIRRESERLQGIIVPAAVYETLPREKVPAELAIGAPERWVAASICLSTVGGDIEREVQEAQHRGETVLNAILHSVSLEALEQSDNFVYRLISEEAKEESCELTRRSRIGSDPGWESFAGLLPGDKIGVRFLGNDRFAPLYSSGGIIYWIPLKKRNTRN